MPSEGKIYFYRCIIKKIPLFHHGGVAVSFCSSLSNCSILEIHICQYENAEISICRPSRLGLFILLISPGTNLGEPLPPGTLLCNAFLKDHRVLKSLLKANSWTLGVPLAQKCYKMKLAKYNVIWILGSRNQVKIMLVINGNFMVLKIIKWTLSCTIDYVSGLSPVFYNF